MKKKIIIAASSILAGLTCFGAGAYSSDEIKAKLFPVRTVINGIAKSGDLPSLNYNNSTYVPLREISHYLGAMVYYDSEFSTIYVDSGQNISSKLPFHHTAKDDLFELSIYAENQQFLYGEPLNILACLKYIGDKELAVTGPGTPFHFYIKDANGNEVGEEIPMIMTANTYSIGDEFIRAIPMVLTANYSIDRFRREHAGESFGRDELLSHRWSVLPRGEYTIGVKADLAQAGSKVKPSLGTEIQIRIK